MENPNQLEKIKTEIRRIFDERDAWKACAQKLASGLRQTPYLDSAPHTQALQEFDRLSSQTKS
jgi:hypothetical protein